MSKEEAKGHNANYLNPSKSAVDINQIRVEYHEEDKQSPNKLMPINNIPKSNMFNTTSNILVRDLKGLLNDDMLNQMVRLSKSELKSIIHLDVSNNEILSTLENTEKFCKVIVKCKELMGINMNN